MRQGGKKGGGGAQKKGGSSIADLLKPRQPYEETDTILQNLLLIENHRRNVGRYACMLHPARACTRLLLRPMI
jgi:hypothetical protein